MKKELVLLDNFEKYASFLLEHHIDQIVKEDIKRNFELNLPLLKYFTHLSEDELFVLSKKGMQEYLEQIVSKRAIDAVLKSMRDWKDDKLKGVGKYQLVASDIALIYNARKYSLLSFLPFYTKDINQAIIIIKEIEDFYTFQEALAIQTFTEIKQEQLKKSETRLKESQTLAHLGHWEYIPVTGKIEWSDELYKIYGLNINTGITAEMIQKQILAEDMPGLMEKIKACAEKNHPFEHEYKIRRADGEIRILVDHGYCEGDENNTVILKGISQDITERKKNEEKINETQLFIAKITNSSPNILYVFDLTHSKTIFINQQIEEYLGYTPEEIKPKGNFRISDLIHPNDLPNAIENLQKLKTAKEGEILQFEYRIRRAGGDWAWLRSHEAVFKRDEKGNAIQIVGSAQDITPNKIAEEELNKKNVDLQEKNEELACAEEALKELNNELEERVRRRTQEVEESAERFRLLAETVPQIFWTAQPDGSIDYFNQRWYDYTGLDFNNTKEWGWQNVIHPEDLKKSIDTWLLSVKTGSSYQMENRFRRADGMYRWHLDRALPFKDKDGKIIKWFGTCTDMHDQKEALEQVKKAQKGLYSINVELSQKNEELIKTNNDLDNFIYTASHDLKAPISNIEGLTNALKGFNFYQDAEVNPLIDMMTLSIEKFKNTIFDLTEITNAQKSFGDEVTEINIPEMLEEVKFSIKDFIKTSKAKIETDFSQCSSIKFSKKNFRSILFNLLSNAIKYKSLERSPEIFIKTEKVIDNYILLTIKDNGLGIDMSQKAKVFSMFKRLHDHVEGTGIGLYIVKRTVENAGGKIDVESEVGKGSTFKVYFKKFTE